MSFYDAYHHSHQYGSGGRGVPNVYVGSSRQKGHGLGSFFTGLFRSALPFLAKGARAIGKEALRTGVNILDDVTENNVSFKESFKNRVNESGRNLKRKAVEKLDKLMDGSGYKGMQYKRNAQSLRAIGKRRITSRKNKRRKTVKRLRKTRKKKVNRRKSKRSSKKTRGARVKSRKTKKAIDIFG